MTMNPVLGESISAHEQLTLAYGELIIVWMTRGSKSNSTERGM